MNQKHQFPPATIRLPASNSRTRLGEMSVLQALDWAFRREHAQLELPERREVWERGRGFGMEYVLIQRARLGVSVDEFGPGNWGGSTPHEDAEVIAAIVSKMPDDLGGRHMAVRVAEHARAGLVPDAMVGALPRFEPVEWCIPNRHGRKAKSEVIGTGAFVHRGRQVNYESRWCQVTLRPDPQQIASARAGYTEWWFAVSHVRRTLRDCGMLREIGITDEMPALVPWEKGS
ncbi:hypothetical protein [Rubellimicrobium arenae]|uniref:hypothetical protein n=1 Tax=Rubellimicrobium arenae TaxID=2817372 RepID=UPI001FEF32FA|nr:hypothetical protein [Rubellimicrobium arenae]